MTKKKKLICAMSGGVDSSVSAALLKKAGFYPELGRRVDVTGVFMKCWSEEEQKTGACTAEEDEMWARRAAAKIGIPFYSVDLVKEYRQRVVEYFFSEYAAGRTPNPDVMCNREIKFGVFYDWAVNELGADYMATGHYVRLLRNRTIPNTRLLKGKDPNKDQSYFLWAVPREHLQRVIFPVGNYLKSEVRAMARKFGLPNHARRDSQGICFIGKVSVRDFLQTRIANMPGVIVNTKGEEVGRHFGLHFYTIGQRKGIQIGGGPPYYVAQKDHAQNTLVVAREYDDELFTKKLSARSWNWIAPKPTLPFHCSAKLRYRQNDERACLQKEDKDGTIYMEFKNLQRAVTPGQSVVLYRGEELIGGGIID